MSGNVWEWTNTIYDQVQFPYPYNPNDGRERFSENTNVIRVSRGGAFSDVPLEYPVRIAFRGANLSNWSSPATGVRCVRSDFFNDLTLQTPTSTNTMPRTPSPTITTTPVSAIPSISISAVNVGFYGERPIGIGCFVYITVVATGNPEGSICVANGAVTDCNYPAGYPSPFTFPTGSTNYQIHLGGIREDGFGTHSVWVSTNYGDSNTLTLACQ
jgi:hypothetical protein